MGALVSVIVLCLVVAGLATGVASVLTLGIIGLGTAATCFGFVGVILTLDRVRREIANQARLSQDLAIRLQSGK